MIFREGQIQTLIDRVGVPAVCSGVTANVIVDRTSEGMLVGSGAAVPGRRVEITQKSGALALVVGATVTIGATSYRIIEVRKVYDGIDAATAELTP